MGAQCGKEQGTYQPFGTSDEKNLHQKYIGLQFTSQKTNSWNPENHLLEKGKSSKPKLHDFGFPC